MTTNTSPWRKWIIAVNFALLATGIGLSSHLAVRIDEKRNGPISGYTNFSAAVRQLQSDRLSSYIPVTSPNFYGRNVPRDLFTQSRLYRDRLELWADTSKRNSPDWAGLAAVGIIDDSGRGDTLVFGTLNPCSPTHGREPKVSDTIRAEFTEQACLFDDHLEIQIGWMHLETVGVATERMVANGLCKRGKWGGCAFDDTPPATYSVYPRR